MVNKIELNKANPDSVIIGGAPVVYGSDGSHSYVDPIDVSKTADTLSSQIIFDFGNLQDIIYAKMVQKVGDRRYWEQWAKNVAEIAERQVERITRLIADKDKHQQAFQGFIEGLRKNINPSISEQEAIDMLSQHIITKPVFDALFEGYSFVSENAISKSMQNMLDLLEEQAIEKDTQTLDKFYESVKMRAQGIDNAEGKQKIIIELYDKFFKTAFPKMVEQLGIVYTPTECVDFIIHSVNDVLQ
jgi:predicted helicase